MMQRWRDTSEDLKPQIANLCMQVGASMPVPSDPAPLTARQPPAHELTSVPAARATRGLHCQAKQPMVQSALGVIAGVTSASDAVLSTRVASRVWLAAVWPWSMWSGSSAQLCGMLVWWAPRHGGVANSGQVWPSAGRTGPLVREYSRFERVNRAGAGHSPRPATAPNRPKTRGRAAGCWSRSRPVWDLSCNDGGL